jgi:hypothetical protein
MPRALPPRPSLDQLKHQAKDVLKAHHAGDAAACRILRRLPKLADASETELLAAAVTLNDAQFALAQEYGFENWPAIKRHVDSLALSRGLRKADGCTWIEGVPVLRFGQGKDCAFAGGLEAATTISRRPYSYSDFMGCSALAFRVRWHEGWCPSCTVGEMEEEADAIGRTTGWGIHWRLGAGGPDMERFTDDIRRSLDNGMPVLVYPPDLNIAVAYGYADEGRVLLLRDHRHGEKERRLPVRELGFLLAFLNDLGEAPPPVETLKHTLRMAIHNWRRGTGHEGPADYFYGEAALRRWSDDLLRAQTLNEEDRKKLFFLTWLNFATIADARAAATSFLRAQAGTAGETVKAPLERAAALYGEEGAFLGAVFGAKDAFLGPWSRKKFEDWTEEVRQRERGILDGVHAYEAKAVRSLEEALAVLESAASDEERHA